MAIRILKEEDFVKTNWSGGTTTQLFIFPPESNFTDRNFDIRISCASVDVEESDFTPLPGYDRKLMVLEGQLEINHSGHHSSTLKKFEQDHFKGDWQTKSKGKVKDFNVIYKPGIEPTIFTLDVLKGENILIENLSKTLVFVNKGRGELSELNITKGDFVIIDGEMMVNFKALINSILIVVQLKNRI